MPVHCNQSLQLSSGIHGHGSSEGVCDCRQGVGMNPGHPKCATPQPRDNIRNSALLRLSGLAFVRASCFSRGSSSPGNASGDIQFDCVTKRNICQSWHVRSPNGQLGNTTVARNERGACGGVGKRGRCTLAMKPRLSMSLLASSTLRLVRSPWRMFMLCKWAIPLATSRAVAKMGVRSGKPWMAERFVRNQPMSIPSCDTHTCT